MKSTPMNSKRGVNTPSESYSEQEDALRQAQVNYHPNGNVKFPVTYAQLLRECERLHAQRDAAIILLAKWAARMITHGPYDCYDIFRQAAFLPTDPPELRKLIDEELKKC